MRTRVLALTAALLAACAPANTTPPATSASTQPAGTASTSPAPGATTSPAASATATPAATSAASTITVDGTTYAGVGTGSAKYGVGENERMAIYCGSINDTLTSGTAYGYVAIKGDLAPGFTTTDVSDVENFQMTVMGADGKKIGYVAQAFNTSDLVITKSTGTVEGTYTTQVKAYDEAAKPIGTDLHTLVYKFAVPVEGAK